jgi:hypothetical protein
MKSYCTLLVKNDTILEEKLNEPSVLWPSAFEMQNFRVIVVFVPQITDTLWQSFVHPIHKHLNPHYLNSKHCGTVQPLSARVNTGAFNIETSRFVPSHGQIL